MSHYTAVGGSCAGNSFVIQSGTSHANYDMVGTGGDIRGTQSTESRAQIKYEGAGTLSLMSFNVITNSTTITMENRIGGVTGNLTASSGASTTGIFQDSTHSDSVSAGNLVCCRFYVAASFPTASVQQYVYRFDGTSNALQQIVSANANNSAGASTTNFFPMIGCDSNSGGTFQSTDQQYFRTEMRVAVTGSNYQAQIITNTSTNATTATLRVSGSDVTQTVSITGSTTGLFEDVTHTDSIGSSDYLSNKWVTGAGTSNALFSSVSMLLTEANAKCDMGQATTYNTVTINMSTSVDSYFNLIGIPVPQASPTTTESTAQVKFPHATNLSHIRFNISQNGGSSTLTGSLRVNGSSVTQSVSLTQNTAGLYEDTTHTDTIAANDLICGKVTHPASGNCGINRVMISQDSATSVAYSDSVTENMTLADTIDNTAAFVATLTEAMTLADTPDAEEDGSGSIVENMTLTDTINVVQALTADVTENMSLTDTLQASLYAESTHNVVVIFMNQVG